jgi:hypothetical protein
MSLVTVLSLAAAFLNVAQANHDSDVEYALQILNDLPKDLAEPFCSSFGGHEDAGATSTYTVTAAPTTTTTTLECSETGGYETQPWDTTVSQAVDSCLEIAYLSYVDPILPRIHSLCQRDLLP